MTLRGAFASLAAVLLALFLGGTAAAQSGSSSDADIAARAAINRCSETLSGVPTSLTELEQDCPDLAGALQGAGIRQLIIESSRSAFDLGSLRQLRNIIHPVGGMAPSVAALDAILRSHRPQPPPPRSWWQRLLDWLGEHLLPKQGLSTSNSWLSGLARQLSKLQWLWTGIIWATFIALPIGVGVIVVREVRAMGRRSLDAPAVPSAGETVGHSDSRLALLRQLPLAQRPARLFAMLIARLVAAQRLPPDRSLTHREVTQRVQLEDAAQRRLIESLARLSERQIYTDADSVPEGTEELLGRAEDLYSTGWGRPAEP